MMRGACLCGGVAFEVTGPLRPIIACHCTQCRKMSGHFWAATSALLDQFRLSEAKGLRWFYASPLAKRGFCKDCGAFLFWQPTDEDRISFAPGALKGPTGLTIESEWFLPDAGDYYAAQPSPSPDHLTGSCLCGANHFTLPGPMGAVTACHCTQCRKLSGHYSASFDAPETSLIWKTRHVTEYVSPGGGQRGFCPECGCKLYFRDAAGGFSVEAGIIDGPTGGRLTGHIFVADKGDYYALTDGLPQFRNG